MIKPFLTDFTLQESNAWVQEIIAKIRDILSTFQQQYKQAAIGQTTSDGELAGGVLPALDDPNFEFFFEQLSESYA